MNHKEYSNHAKIIWSDLVPKSGQADTVAGELLRALEKLRDEAQRNGNINWRDFHENLANFILNTLINSQLFSKKINAEIESDINKILNYESPETSDSTYDRLTYRIVDWDLANPERPHLEYDLTHDASYDAEGVVGVFGTEPDKPALVKAVESRDYLEIKRLIEKGVDLEEKDEFDGTVLATAAAFGDLEMIRLLLNAGADIHHIDGVGQSILDMATYRPEAHALLVEHGAKPNRK